jgi:hypothetical protein
MFPSGAPRGGGVSVSRFVPAPRVVCSHGFQSRLLRKHSLVGLLACRKRSHRGHLPDLADRDDLGWSLGLSVTRAQAAACGRGASDLPSAYADDASDQGPRGSRYPFEKAHPCELAPFPERTPDFAAKAAPDAVRLIPRSSDALAEDLPYAYPAVQWTHPVLIGLGQRREAPRGAAGSRLASLPLGARLSDSSTDARSGQVRRRRIHQAQKPVRARARLR